MGSRHKALFALFLQALFLLPEQGRCKTGHSHNVSSSVTKGSHSKARKQVCNLYQGSWVEDSTYPLFNPKGCPFIDPEFDCVKYGRPDLEYLKYRWQPSSCAVPRFDGNQFLKTWGGKKIMFVGDSLSQNMWESLACMIYASVPNSKTVVKRNNPISSITFQDCGLNLSLYRTPYLVDVVKENGKSILDLDSINAGEAWKGMDMLVFNSWHWWLHRGVKSQGWELIRSKGKLVHDMDRLEAFREGLTTWGNWVDNNVDPSKTKLFFQGISPTHTNGNEWNQPGATCKGQQEPLPGSRYPGGAPPATGVVSDVLKQTKTKVELLDITLLSQLRVDAHPSAYSGDHPGNDCSHWCIPGLPDTWNQLLYAALVGTARRR
ncbi:protein trichome birefringence-like 37 [Malania oleifera]|uniref:protein trichome birefringence-like 37 n=1 Tax=Malania oleifera TaxID=397392 RepID=UPI0025ADE703|nr:protein trichome birefringence-like 37 [Malania oleifera]